MKKKYYYGVWLFVLTIASLAHAFNNHCAAGPNGAIFCAINPSGSAVVTRSGEAYCGIGQCVQSAAGFVHCSPFEGGGVVVALTGYCYAGKGDCVVSPMGYSYCSNKVGGWATISANGFASCEGGCVSGESCVAGDSFLCRKSSGN